MRSPYVTLGAKVRKPSLRVLFATPECAPWLKTGGLGDVAAALPQALRALSVDVRVLLPAYRPVLAAAGERRECARFEPLAQLPAARLLEARLPSGVPALLIECAPLYERGGGAYLDEAGRDWEDNWLRFGQLGRVAASLGGDRSPLAWRPQVLHCNDWQAGLAPAYLRYSGERRARTLMAVHNASFQGLFPPTCLEPLGLPGEAYAVSGLEFFGRVSFLKAGLRYADAICTVSPTYAREIQEAPLGCGLEGLLAERRGVLHGILNGIDEEIWDPHTDAAIASRYDARSLERKAASKAALQRRFGLEVSPRTMLFGAVSRLTWQKGIDLIVEAAPDLLALPSQLAVVGTGEPRLERTLEALARAHPGRIGVRIAFDEADAHLIEAGADAFLMPSRFEPCGLNQMYSQRYGTPPVARATGGLADTIEDGQTGFLFAPPQAAALAGAARRAHAAYLAPERWHALQRNGMAKDFGWDRSARAYAALYAQLFKAIA
jgi:starch synthase